MSSVESVQPIGDQHLGYTQSSKSSKRSKKAYNHEDDRQRPGNIQQMNPHPHQYGPPNKNLQHPGNIHGQHPVTNSHNLQPNSNHISSHPSKMPQSSSSNHKVHHSTNNQNMYTMPHPNNYHPNHSPQSSTIQHMNHHNHPHQNGPFPPRHLDHKVQYRVNSDKQEHYLDSRLPPPPAYPEPPRYPGHPPPRTCENDTKQNIPSQYRITEVEDQARISDKNMQGSEDLQNGLRIDRNCQMKRNENDFREIHHNPASEINQLREQIHRLNDDNQELRDLCCFLDDDRQKGRKLAREWQRFGRYTASVMRQEVSAYQNKLRELDSRQQELIKDNLELKELCLYLDEERNNAACSQCGHPLITRDDGDGSSSSTNADEPLGPISSPSSDNNLNQCQFIANQISPSDAQLSRSSSRENLLDQNNRNTINVNEQIVSYIKSLERRVSSLETEKHQLEEEMRSDHSQPEGFSKDKLSSSSDVLPPPYSLSHHLRSLGIGINRSSTGTGGSIESEDELLDDPPPPPPPSMGVTRPAAVAAAIRVLEVQEQLQVPISYLSSEPSPRLQPSPITTNNYLDDDTLAEGEKALLRQMCNVVWKKLEEVPSQNR